MPHYYAFMRAGYVLDSLECLKRGVVGKCCSNVLRSLRAYGVVVKAVHACVCEKSGTAYARSSRCAIPYIQPSARSYTPTHTCMPTYQIQTRPHALHVWLPTFIPVHNAIAYTVHKHAPLLRTHASRLCIVLECLSVVTCTSAEVMWCNPFAPMELFSRLYAHVCERRAIQHRCVAHNARSHTCNRVRRHIHPCISACRHTKYKHALPSFQCTTQ
jgi:hypothetical protein